jgi:Protein of unknown function (DUF3298)/Deacetylase PdaC
VRRAALAIGMVLAGVLFVPSTQAASASSWRAVLSGTVIHGGATTLITNQGSASFSVRIYGVSPGTRPIADISPTSCGVGSQPIAVLRLGPADGSGMASGSRALTAAEVAAYRRALSLHATPSVLVVAQAGASACGNQIGAPSVGTGRLRGTISAVAAGYDLRYPVIGGVGAVIADGTNRVLRQEADSALAAFTAAATSGGKPSSGAAPSEATQTFSVSLSQPTLVSLGVLYYQYETGAAHGLASLSTFSFDLRTGHRLILADLFRPGSSYLGVLSSESRHRLRALFPNDALIAMAIDLGTTASSANFGGWQLEPNGLRITFGEYQVGPFSIGMPSIVIPWSSLRGVLVRNPISGGPA